MRFRTKHPIKYAKMVRARRRREQEWEERRARLPRFEGMPEGIVFREDGSFYGIPTGPPGVYHVKETVHLPHGEQVPVETTITIRP